MKNKKSGGIIIRVIASLLFALWLFVLASIIYTFFNPATLDGVITWCSLKELASVLFFVTVILIALFNTMRGNEALKKSFKRGLIKQNSEPIK